MSERELLPKEPASSCGQRWRKTDDGQVGAIHHFSNDSEEPNDPFSIFVSLNP